MKKKIKRIQELGWRRTFRYVCVRSYQKMRVFFYKNIFSQNLVHLINSRLNQPVIFNGEGRISLEEVEVGVVTSTGFLSGSSYFEARASSAEILISKGTIINNNATIVADRSRIFIGERCLIGANFTAYDSDFHGLELENRNNSNYEVKPIVIESDVFIGSDVTILKGCVVGRGAVIGAGSVVVSDIGCYEVWGGFPAKFIKKLSSQGE